MMLFLDAILTATSFGFWLNDYNAGYFMFVLIYTVEGMLKRNRR